MIWPIASACVERHVQIHADARVAGSRACASYCARTPAAASARTPDRQRGVFTNRQLLGDLGDLNDLLGKALGNDSD
jgi:hypothetical protein